MLNFGASKPRVKGAQPLLGSAPVYPLTYNITFANIILCKYNIATRMHFSRMHTICCSGCLSCHTCPLPDTPPAMHTPCHTCSLCHKPPFAMHTPFTMHAPPSPHTLPHGWTDVYENITFPQLLLWTVNIYVSLRLRVQNTVPAQPCVGKIRISLVLLNFLHCNFRLWFETP